MSPFHPNPESGDILYTLGTSTRSLEEFFALLKEHGIEAGVDIRSVPTSRFPHFIRETLRDSFESIGLHYYELGKDLGGFRKGGYLAYTKTDAFRRGIERLETIGKERRTVFFCAEKFPWNCHRRWVAQALSQKGWRIIHILDQGKVWTPEEEHHGKVERKTI